jgi:hypothetical protein
MREAEMGCPGANAILLAAITLSSADADRACLGEVVPEAVMSSAILGSTLAVDRLRSSKTKPGSACKSTRRLCKRMPLSRAPRRIVSLMAEFDDWDHPSC